MVAVEEVLYLVVEASMGILGILLLFTPVKRILEFDRQWGHLLYKSVLRKTGEKAKARFAAGIIYRTLGAAMVVVALVVLLSPLL